jgi:hypothetical protein
MPRQPWRASSFPSARRSSGSAGPGALDELAAWYRDLVVVGAGAPEVAIHADRLDELREDGTRERMLGAEAAAERVRETWRLFEELQLQAGLALEALFVQLRRELAPAV